MHPTDVDPGVTLAGRYRVAELLAESPGDGGVAQTWRAIDEVLSRSVVVHVLAAEDPRAPTLLEASRHAATVSDARFIRVLDAMGEDGVAYVVREWVHGRSLATLLADGPLPPRNAGLIVREVAEALASAHTQGLTHERLDPDCVVVTDAGSIKIVGLATQLALTDGTNHGADGGADRDPARADALGLGRLLYAGLTARWPTGPRSGLEAALRSGDGSLLSPRQCLAGIPKALDEITDRILSDQPRHGTPLESPDQVSAALIEAVGITPPEGVLPISGPPPSNSALVGGYELTAPFQGRQHPNGAPPGPPPGSERTVPVPTGQPMGPPRNRPPAPGGRPPRPPAGRGPGGGGRGGYPGGPPPRPADRPYRQPSGTRWRRAATLLVGIVLFIGLILLGWQLLRGAFQSNNTADDQPTTKNEQTKQDTPTPTQPSKPLSIAAGGDLDPRPQGNGQENGDDAPLAYDGKADTAWKTQTYYDPLEQQKPGVGMWVDLGSVKDIADVKLTLLGTGSDLELLAAPEAASDAPSSLDAWQQVGKAAGAGETADIKLDEPAKTRFLLVWFTKLPKEGGNYRGGVAEIVVRQ
ncbi:protein kinase family protein [Flindersiella endophytica]